MGHSHLQQSTPTSHSGSPAVILFKFNWCFDSISPLPLSLIRIPLVRQQGFALFSCLTFERRMHGRFLPSLRRVKCKSGFLLAPMRLGEYQDQHDVWPCCRTFVTQSQVRGKQPCREATLVSLLLPILFLPRLRNQWFLLTSLFLDTTYEPVSRLLLRIKDAGTVTQNSHRP